MKTPLQMLDDAKRRIMKARSNLIMEEPFWGVLALRLKPVLEEGCGTAWTDGTSLAFDPKFVAKLTDQQLNAVVAHEVGHCALLHHARLGKRDASRWNQAADNAVNWMLQRAMDGGATCFAWPTKPEPLKDPAFADLSAEEIYNRLPIPPPGDKGKGGKEGEGDGQEGKGNPDPGGMGGVKPPPGDTSPAIAEENWKQALVQAAQAAKLQGRLPAGMERLIDDLVAPVVPWQQLLRQFVTRSAKDDWSWLRPNRRMLAHGYYLPGLHSQRIGPIAVAVDTSGSCSTAQAPFLSECQAILDELRPERMILMDNDAALAQVREFAPGDIIPKSLKGGGGTDFRPPFQHLEQNGEDIACLVFLTDLEGTFPDAAPPYPVLWVSTDEGQAPFGETVRMRITN